MIQYPHFLRASDLPAPAGFLFIGDPHVSSVQPGKRTDNYVAAVFGKLSQAAVICRQQNLIPVFLGDLIHRDGENSVGLLSRLTLKMQEFPCIPLEVNGNHGKHSTVSVEEDVEFLLNAAGVLELMDQMQDIREFQISGTTVRMYVAPYGVQLPESVPAGEGVFNVMVSHHDLAFQGAYPGAQELAEIAGLDMLVNGHMHKTAPSIIKGSTIFHCPGNISRLSTDTADHKPAVWEWRPAFGQEIRPHYLEVTANCFDMSGKIVVPATPKEAIAELKESRFAALLTAERDESVAKTDEAAYLMDDLDTVMLDLQVSKTTQALLRMLAAEVSSGTTART